MLQSVIQQIQLPEVKIPTWFLDLWDDMETTEQM